MVVQDIQKLLETRASLVYVVSEEEERVEKIVASAASKVLGKSAVPYTWSCIEGIRKGGEVIDSTADPVKALAAYLKIRDSSPLLFKDLHLVLDGNAPLVRQLKECARILRPSRKTIFFVCPHMALSLELLPLFRVVDVPLPTFEELSRMLDGAIDIMPEAKSLRQSVTPDLKAKLVRAALGFTAYEALDAFRSALMNRDTVTIECVDLVLAEKRAMVEKSGVLEFVTSETGTWEIGGLFNLKKWLNERGEAFSLDVAKQGLKPPKGILVMGVSGCGKSLAVKAIATHWKLPLLRLDMGRVYDGLAGLPEEAMRKAIKTAEAVAPCVLWIDEIEAGIANQKQKAAGGSESRVLALFLTWMQEKTAPVFVGATANEVEVLPPEVLRKGRFDELFYLGLPSKEERKEILSIHMKKVHLDPDQYDMDYLAASTEGQNGAELEQGVVSAVFEAKAQDTQVTEHVLANCLRNVVPLSRTMRERIEKIEAWARDRAMKASLTVFDSRN